MQLATACADGVVAAMGLKEYFRSPESWSDVEPEAIEREQVRGY
jgi:hypothetical protein